jgi:hypothetical protein
LPGGGGRGLVSALLGGWSLAGLAVVRSGEPINILRGIDFNDDGDATIDRPALISGNLTDLYARGSHDRTQYLLPQAEAITRLATPQSVDPAAMIARNGLRAPRVMFYDVSVMKRVAITERVRASVEANFFNVFNRANFGAPIATLTNPRFGQITSTLVGTTPRQIQLGVKVAF